ncbi:unnamed protein product [Urochloa decumbens]|uniref:UBC core domain-containing protein n=1 Tax=Urochloa decumbens TaxID=240449 RepID=A0ABC8VYA4_9POAL
MMHDATGQPIFWYDLVAFQTSGSTHDRGLALKALPGNKLSVLRVDGTEVAKKPCDLTVVDRTFMCTGMAVTSRSDPSRQPGVITGVTTALDLVRLDGGGSADEPTVVATGVSPAEVRLVRELVVGDYVVSGPWLGRVLEVSVDVDVLFDGGSAVCRVTAAGAKQLRVVDRGNWSSYTHDFYPGDRVAGDASVFKAFRWLKGHWKPSRSEGTVAKVEMGGVLVYWVASLHAAVSATASAPPPAYQPNPRKLTFFCSGDATLLWYWCVADRCFFRRTPTPPLKKKHRRHRTMRMGVKQRTPRLDSEFERPMVVADTHTTVDVLWQDGTRQKGVPSASLQRILVRNEQDFFPGQHVVGKTTPSLADDANVGGPRVGVIKSLSYKDQTVCVSWKNTATPGEVVDTVVSTYDLARSPEHNFFYGDIVVRLQPRTPSAMEGGTNDLSWVGHIVDLCDARYLEVKWGDGTTSQVLLHEIAFVKRQNADDILKELGDWVRDDEDEDDDDAFDKAQEDMPPSTMDNNTGGDYNSDGPVEAMKRKVGNIIQSVIRRASEMLGQGMRYHLVSGSAASASTTEPATTENIYVKAAPKAGQSDSTGGDVLFHFQHFDIVQSPQDHHYLNSKEQGGGGGSKWLKRVHKEWKILETSLPDTIFVRAFEDRMDLLRAVMVGASGTPYHDGLFFFDLHLPPSYPATPPLVKYHAFGLRANPNLYPSGTVCLSLLNTFGGKGAELWSPEASSVLQVVVSIQGLVFTAQPYYNEAGYAAQVGTPEGRRNELPYCENTYLVNLHTMLHLIRRPPASFEEFIKDHFKRRGRYVLKACEAYLQQGCPVGTLDGDAFATEVSRERSCSVGFRLALTNIVPQLVEAFARIGGQMGNEVDQK